jgi:hypothetical protein
MNFKDLSKRFVVNTSVFTKFTYIHEPKTRVIRLFNFKIAIGFWVCRSLVSKPLQKRRSKPLTGAPPVSFETIAGLYQARSRTDRAGRGEWPFAPTCFLSRKSATPDRAIPSFAWACCIFLSPTKPFLLTKLSAYLAIFQANFQGRVCSRNINCGKNN